MKNPARTCLYVSALLITVGYGCKSDPEEAPDGDDSGGVGAAGSGGNAGKAGSGGRAGSGGSAGSGNAGRGGSSNSPAGAAGAPEASAGAGGEGNSAGAGGEENSAGAGGREDSAGTGGAAGETAAAGAGGAPAEDPRCAEVASDATVISHLKITADNECDVYVNGEPVGTTNNWGAAVTLDVSLYVHPGRRNVVAVEARNTSSQGGNDRGLVGELTTTQGELIAPLIVTNSQWRVSQTPGESWTLLDYDDSAWIPATEIATVGEGPWGQVIANTDVKWIWFAPIPSSPSDKPNLETTYARRVFYFDFDGVPSAEPLCNEPDPGSED
jgi:hypothetical protein